MARSFATFDAAQLGAHLELQESALVVTHDHDSDDISRTVLCTLAVVDGLRYAEGVFWGVDGTLAGFGSIGVATDDEVLTNYVGESVESFGFRPGDGAIYNDAAAIASDLQPVVKGQVFGLVLDLDASPPTFAVWIAGTEAAVVELPADRTWKLALSVGGAVAYDLSGFVNFGQRRFEHAVPDGADPGFFEESAAPDLLRASTLDFVTRPTDDPANTVFPQMIESDGQAFLLRGMNVWTWGGSPVVRQGLGAIEMVNDGRLDYLLGEDRRDGYVAIRAVDLGGAYADSVVAATAVIDRVETKLDRAMIVRLRDTLSPLQVPLLDEYFLPSTPVAAVANTVVPLTLGAVRNVEGVLYDDVERLYKLGDCQIDVSVVRTKGDPLETDTDPPQWVSTDDLTGVQLLTDPTGKSTADCSAVGDLEVPVDVDDALAGKGKFTDTTWVDDDSSFAGILIDIPDAWETLPDRVTVSGGIVYTDDDADVYGWGPGTGSYAGGGCRRIAFGGRDCLWLGACDNQSSERVQYWGLRTTSEVLVAGVTYKWQLVVDYISSREGNVALFASDSAGTTDDGATWIVRVNSVGTYSGYYTPAVDQRIYLAAHRGFNTLDPTPAKGALVSALSFRDVSTGVGDQLAGISLAEFERQILVVRKRLPDYAYASEDLEAIDTATGYLIGFHTREQMQAIDVLAAPLNSYCASVFPDRAGVLRFVRLIDPDEVDDVDVIFELNVDNLLGAFDVKPDLAPGLTNSIGVRRNWSRYTDADFVDGFDPDTGVPAATRTAYKAEAQVIRTSSVNLSERYRAARGNKPLISLFDNPLHGQAEIDRVCGLYRIPRNFYGPLVFRMPDDYSAEPGQVFVLRWARYGLDAGRKLLIRTLREDWRKREVTIEGWGA